MTPRFDPSIDMATTRALTPPPTPLTPLPAAVTATTTAPATTTTPEMTVRDANTKANFIAWFKEVFGFTNAVAKAVYNKQLLQDKKTLAELSDSKIGSIMRAIRRTQPIANISAAQLKLAIFWIKHQDHTQRAIGITAAPLMRVNLDTIMILKTQKQLEDDWRLGNKEPDYPTATLDLALATKTLNKTRTVLTCAWGNWRTPFLCHLKHTRPTPRG